MARAVVSVGGDRATDEGDHTAFYKQANGGPVLEALLDASCSVAGRCIAEAGGSSGGAELGAGGWPATDSPPSRAATKRRLYKKSPPEELWMRQKEVGRSELDGGESRTIGMSSAHDDAVDVSDNMGAPTHAHGVLNRSHLIDCTGTQAADTSQCDVHLLVEPSAWCMPGSVVDGTGSDGSASQAIYNAGQDKHRRPAMSSKAVDVTGKSTSPELVVGSFESCLKRERVSAELGVLSGVGTELVNSAKRFRSTRHPTRVGRTCPDLAREQSALSRLLERSRD